MAISLQGARSDGVPAHGSAHINVGSAERIASAVGGGVLLAAAGCVLAYRGLSGHCPAFAALGLNTAEARGHPVEVETAVTVYRPRDEVYAFWRSLENLPRFMHHLRRVERRDGNRSRWVAKGTGPLPDVAWDAETTQDRENELLAWRSLPGADVDNAGRVRFSDAPNGGTEVHVLITYRPPAGTVGSTVAKWLDPVLGQMVKEDVRRFKRIMETGEVPTTDGQPSGRAKGEG